MDVWWHRVGMPARLGRDRSPSTRPALALPTAWVGGLADAEAEALAAAELLHCDLRCDDAPWDGDATAELAESRRGADDDTEPASADVPAAGGHVNARELVAAHLPARGLLELRSTSTATRRAELLAGLEQLEKALRPVIGAQG